MASLAMMVLSLLTGSVAAGAVWLSWSFAENWAAARRRQPGTDEAVLSEVRGEQA